jgi:hypothetical protein
MYVPTVAVDFDGTLASGNNFPDIGEPNPEAREAMEYLREAGYRIIIWTCRTCHWHYDQFGGDPAQPTLERHTVLQMIEWLHAHKIPYDEIDDGSKGKVMADFYIDDKSLRYVPGPDGWADVCAFIESRRQKGPESHGKVTNTAVGGQLALE